MPKLVLTARDLERMVGYLRHLESIGASRPRLSQASSFYSERLSVLSWGDWRALELYLPRGMVETLDSEVELFPYDRALLRAAGLDGAPPGIRPGSWYRLRTGEAESISLREWRRAWEGFPPLLRFLIDASPSRKKEGPNAVI